jgi:hypothetical protein
MEKLHIYELVGENRLGVIFNPREIRHEEAEIIKVTKSVFEYERKNHAVETVNRKRLNRVMFGSRVILTTPNTELAKVIFTNYLNDRISEYEEKIATCKKALRIVKKLENKNTNGGAIT